MRSDWQEAIDFYQDLANGPALGEYRFLGIVKFLKMLVAHRSLSGIECFTFKDDLYVTLYKTDEERRAQPYVTIDMADDRRLVLVFVHSTEEPGEVWRASKEEVSCPLENGLKYFDEMVGRLKEFRKKQQDRQT